MDLASVPIFNPDRADERELSSKIAALPLAVGDSVRLETAGGGGYGNPAERSPERIERDRRAGKTS